MYFEWNRVAKNKAKISSMKKRKVIYYDTPFIHHFRIF